MQGLPLVQVKNVSKSFAGVRALNDVSFSIYPGERLTLVGENGSGKSTIIKIIAGVQPCDEGEILIAGHDYPALSPKEAISAGIQVIYQDFSLFPNLTVAENLAFNAHVASGDWRMDWKQTEQIAKQALERIGVEIPLDELAGNLSAADRQLIAIAKALLKNTSLIIMDEPTTALTKKEVKNLLWIIDELKAQGISTVFVSHKMEEVLTVSDRVVVLRNGELIMEKSIDELDRQAIVEAMSGVRLEETKAQAKPKTGVPALSVQGLALPPALVDASFDLYPGQVLGITGLLGSGRAELARALMGITPASAGTLRIEGQPVSIRSVAEALQHRIALVPEDRLSEGLFIDSSIGFNMMCRVLQDFESDQKLLNWGALKQKAQEWVATLKVKTTDCQLPVSSLSGGNQQKVVLAKWLAFNPRILILVGPTVGVDIRAKMEIIDKIHQLAEQGLSVIVITDDIPELLQVSNAVMVMTKGHSSEVVSIDDVDEQWVIRQLAFDGEEA